MTEKTTSDLIAEIVGVVASATRRCFMGPHYRSETFYALKESENRRFGDYASAFSSLTLGTAWMAESSPEDN
jgi:hypothetical protein